MKKFIILMLAALMIVGLCISCKEPDPKDELYGKWVYKDEEDTLILDVDGKGAFTLSLDEAFELKGTYKINDGKVTMEIDPSSVPAGEVDKYYVFLGDVDDPVHTAYIPGDDEISICFNAETTTRPTSASSFVEFDVQANKIYSNPYMTITLETDKIIIEMDLSQTEATKTVCEVTLDFEADKTENTAFSGLDWFCSYTNMKATKMSVDSDYSIKDNKLSIWFFDFDGDITQFTFTKE